MVIFSILKEHMLQTYIHRQKGRTTLRKDKVVLIWIDVERSPIKVSEKINRANIQYDTTYKNIQANDIFLCVCTSVFINTWEKIWKDKNWINNKSTSRKLRWFYSAHSLTPLPSKHGAYFPFPWMWAKPSDLLPTSRMQWKRSYATSKAKS